MRIVSTCPSGEPGRSIALQAWNRPFKFGQTMRCADFVIIPLWFRPARHGAGGVAIDSATGCDQMSAGSPRPGNEAVCQAAGLAAFRRRSEEWSWHIMLPTPRVQRCRPALHQARRRGSRERCYRPPNRSSWCASATRRKSRTFSAARRAVAAGTCAARPRNNFASR